MSGRMEEFGRDCCIHGYHVYKEMWRATIGEELECDRQPENSSDRYAVAVKRSGVVIGHLPRKLSRVCSLFLRRGGVISCMVTGECRYSGDLPQGGMEIPCFLLGLPTLIELGAKWMVEMAQYITDNPQIIVNGFIKAGITGALDGHMDNQDEPENDDTVEIDSDEDESDLDGMNDEVDLTDGY